MEDDLESDAYTSDHEYGRSDDEPYESDGEPDESDGEPDDEPDDESDESSVDTYTREFAGVYDTAMNIAAAQVSINETDSVNPLTLQEQAALAIIVSNPERTPEICEHSLLSSGPFGSIFSDIGDPLAGSNGYIDISVAKNGIGIFGDTFGFRLWEFSGYSRVLNSSARDIWCLIKSPLDWTRFLAVHPSFITDFTKQRQYLFETTTAQHSFAYKAILSVYFKNRKQADLSSLFTDLLLMGVKLNNVGFTHAVLMLKELEDRDLRHRVRNMMNMDVYPITRAKLIIWRKLKVIIGYRHLLLAAHEIHNIDLCRIIIREGMVELPTIEHFPKWFEPRETLANPKHRMLAITMFSGELNEKELFALLAFMDGAEAVAVIVLGEILLYKLTRHNQRALFDMQRIKRVFQPKRADIERFLLKHGLPSSDIAARLIGVKWDTF